MHYLLSHNIERVSRSRPENTAFRFNGEQLSYGQLDLCAGQLASQLSKLGVRRGDRVGIHMHKSLDLPVAIYGVLKAGAAYVPIDPLAPRERISFIMNDCQIKCLISEDSKLPVLDQSWIASTPLKFIIGVELPAPGVHSVSWPEVMENGALESGPKMNETDLAYIIFTSGSTGRPKGIMHSHLSALNYAKLSANTYELTESDVLSNFSSLHFDMSTMDYLTVTYAGASAVIISEAYTKMPASLSKLIQDEAISVWYSVPFALIQLLQHGLLEQRDLSSLRWVLYGGEPFAPKHLRKLMDLWPHAQFSNVYGPAEVNQCTYYHLPESFSGKQESVPIGKTWTNTRALLLDDDDQVIEDAGTPGELVVKAPTMMRGYWNNPQMNSQCFFDYEIYPGISDRYYRTGDIASINQRQELMLHGRKDRQVKIRGYRIELDEIESVIGSYEGVKQCAAYTVDVRQQDNSDIDGIFIEVMLTVKNAQLMDAWDIHRHAYRSLPAYARPKEILITQQFPLTTSGKIDRRKLAADASARYADQST